MTAGNIVWLDYNNAAEQRLETAADTQALRDGLNGLVRQPRLLANALATLFALPTDIGSAAARDSSSLPRKAKTSGSAIRSAESRAGQCAASQSRFACRSTPAAFCTSAARRGCWGRVATMESKLDGIAVGVKKWRGR